MSGHEPPHSDAGAKPARSAARSLALHGGHFGYDFGAQDTMVGQLLIYLLPDSAALGGSVGLVPVPPSPDAEMLAACAAFDALERAYHLRPGRG